MPSLAIARRAAGLTVIWIGVGVVSGIQLYIAGTTRGHELLWSLIATQIRNALPWVPVTALILVAVRVQPITRDTWRTHLPAYFFGAVAIVWAVNITQVVLQMIVEGNPPGSDFWRTVTSGTLEWGHVAFVVVVALMAIGHATSLRRSARSGSAAMKVTPLSHPEQRSESPYMEKVSARVGRTTKVFDATSIDWIEAAGDYVRAHIGDASYLIQARMSDLERRLDPNRFARIHRSTIVNLISVREFLPASHGDYELVLDGGTRLRLSRNRREAVQRLKSLGTASLTPR